MNLQDLKEMIKEEFEAYNEQEDPMVSVSDADVDTDGGEDSEDTLKQIYDMLKDYFEGDKDDADDKERFKKLANIIKG